MSVVGGRLVLYVLSNLFDSKRNLCLYLENAVRVL